MTKGIFFALCAGLLWGLIFIGPLLLPDYPGMIQSAGRYTAFGLITLPLSWCQRHRLRNLHRKDWFEAFKLSLVGNLIYYTCLSSAIQRIGAPISTMIVGILPMILVVTANIMDRKHNPNKLPWKRLVPALFLIAIGLICINTSELRSSAELFNLRRYLSGIILALIAVVCWTWYPLRNARWLQCHCHKPITWATAQGLVTLPLATIAYGLICLGLSITQQEFSVPFGPRPLFFILLMITIGLLCSWLGAFCWNEASQRLPTILVGPLVTFETLSGLAYTFLLREMWPSILTFSGVICLVLGVAISIKPKLVDRVPYFNQ
ncbi:DMT family transporter [Candidatus Curculioniphilus buchneri]|uniref:DMT family transporter n=1 Tax=Candidatus Curculioniphilus buchneri TaxID=690594 RepID=UPI00376EDE0C